MDDPESEIDWFIDWPTDRLFTKLRVLQTNQCTVEISQKFTGVMMLTIKYFTNILCVVCAKIKWKYDLDNLV